MSEFRKDRAFIEGINHVKRQTFIDADNSMTLGQREGNDKTLMQSSRSSIVDRESPVQGVCNVLEEASVNSFRVREFVDKLVGKADESHELDDWLAVRFKIMDLVNWWIDQAEFGTKNLKGYGFFYGTSRDLPGIRQYTKDYLKRTDCLPYGFHVIDRNYHDLDTSSILVTFPVRQ